MGKITRSKEKGEVGAPRAFISSDGRAINRPQKLHAQKRMGIRRAGAWITRRPEKITRSKEKGAVGAPRALYLL